MPGTHQRLGHPIVPASENRPPGRKNTTRRNRNDSQAINVAGQSSPHAASPSLQHQYAWRPERTEPLHRAGLVAASPETHSATREVALSATA
jgi:hypothetical protein